MASGSFSTSVAGGHYTLRADWSGTGAASNNTTPVNVKLYLVNDWNLDIGSRSGTITINGTATSITSSSISSKGTHLLGQATTNVVHNADGTKSITIAVKWSMNATISGYGYIGEISTSKTVTLDTIPRYATSVQSVKSKTATSITMNWSSDSTIDYVWYSKNGGSSWTAVGSVNAKSGSYTISGLTGGTAYSIKTRVRRKDSQLTTDSSALSVTTYAIPTCTISLTSKTETSAVIKWTSNKTISKVEYSTNNGSTYVVYSSTGGSVSISGLTRNTTYNIKIRVTSNEGVVGTSSALEVTTYQYPYISKISTSALTIGGSQTVTIYNPLGRNVAVYMKKTSTTGTILYSGSTTGTSLTFTPNATTLYNSITGAQSATCVYYCVWNETYVSTVSGTYKVDATASKPTIGSVSYADQDSAIAQWTGNNQLIVQNQSLCGFTASGISVKNSATISSVKVTVLNVDHAMTYSSGSASVAGFRINASSNQKAVVTVTDSRGLTATAEVTVQMLAWSAPTALISLERENNFYSTTHITVDAIYSSVNRLNTVTIEYTATADGETTITGALQDNVEATFTANNEKDWNVQITVTDHFATAVYTRGLSRGTPIIFFDNNLNSVGVNCFPTDAESLEVVSTDGSSNHNVAAELEQHEDEINKSVKVTTAGTAVGSGTKPIYINASGQAIASGSTVGASAKPIFLSSGVLTASNSSLGGTTKPIYMASGELKALSGSLGGTTQPIYMTSGEFKACTDIYRSGTWTPSFANNSITLTAGIVRGWYMKIGKMVLVGMSLKAGTLKNGSTSTQTIKITGLPFTPDTVVLHYSGGGHVQGTGLRWNGTSTTNMYHYLTGFTIDSTATAGIFLRTLANNTEKANGTAYVQIPASATVSSVYMSCTITYMATS